MQVLGCFVPLRCGGVRGGGGGCGETEKGKEDNINAFLLAKAGGE